MQKRSKLRPIIRSGPLSLVILVLLMTSTKLIAQTAEVETADKDNTTAAAKTPDEVKITFDEKDPTIMYVESNGQRYQVNSTAKTVERVTPTGAEAAESKPESDVNRKSSR